MFQSLDVFSHAADGMREDGWWKMRCDESDEISPSKETYNDGLEGLIKIENLCPALHPFEHCATTRMLPEHDLFRTF